MLRIYIGGSSGGKQSGCQHPKTISDIYKNVVNVLSCGGEVDGATMVYKYYLAFEVFFVRDYFFNESPKFSLCSPYRNLVVIQCSGP